MKVESTVRPEGPFEILNYEGENVEVLFYENITEIDQNEEDEAKKYSYDLYRLIVKDRTGLKELIELNLAGWSKLAKDKEIESKNMTIPLENQNRADIDYIAIMTGVDL